MLFRICAAMVLLGSPSLMAQTTDLNGKLESHQEHMHKKCKIQSPQMKLVFACYKMQLEDANPKFHPTVPGSNDGVSYCFNGLIHYDPAKKMVQVLKDDGESARHYQFSPRENKTVRINSAGALNLPLNKVHAYCYSKDPLMARKCWGGLFGFGSTNPKVILSVTQSESTAPIQNIAVNLDDGIANQNGNSLRASDTVDHKLSNEIVLQYAQSTILKFARNPTSSRRQDFPDVTEDDVKICRDAIVAFENANPSAFNGQLYILGKLNAEQLLEIDNLLKVTRPSSNNTVPTEGAR